MSENDGIHGNKLSRYDKTCFCRNKLAVDPISMSCLLFNSFYAIKIRPAINICLFGVTRPCVCTIGRSVGKCFYLL